MESFALESKDVFHHVLLYWVTNEPEPYISWTKTMINVPKLRIILLKSFPFTSDHTVSNTLFSAGISTAENSLLFDHLRSSDYVFFL